MIQVLLQEFRALKDESAILVNLCCQFLTTMTNDNPPLNQKKKKEQTKKKLIKGMLSKSRTKSLKNLHSVLVLIVIPQCFRSCGATETLWDDQSSASLWHPGCVQNENAKRADSAWLRTNTNAPLMRAPQIYPQRQNDAIHY